MVHPHPVANGDSVILGTGRNASERAEGGVPREKL